ncbi:MAG: CHAT domain-containing protein, partial [Caldilineales bacterium]
MASLPWELLAYDDEPLVASGRVQLTRYITFAQATAPYPVTDRLEVLTITARPRDALTLDATAEVDAIQAAFDALAQRRIVRIHSLSPPTPDALAAAVNARTYHIIHFDGHGMVGRRCPYCGRFSNEEALFCTNARCGARLDEASLEGCLLFESNRGDGLSQMVSPRELATVLAERQVRLFIASACQSGAVKGATVFNSIGPRLLLAGIPAVVAMQFSVPVDSTVVFSSEFYAALARSESVAAATSAGRRILINRGTWHIPALYLRSRDGAGNLFRFRDAARWQSELVGGEGAVRVYFVPAGSSGPDWNVLHPPEAAPYKFLSPYEVADKAVFFGRSGETQELLGEVLQRPLALLQGPPGIGKTSLVNAGLVPELLGNGYLVLSVDRQDDPVAALIEAVGRSTALRVDVAGVQDLAGLAALLQQEIGYPLAIVFDHLEEFLRTGDSAAHARLVSQLATLAGQPQPLPVRVVLVVREDFVGRLTAQAAGLPDLWKTPVSLGPLSRAQATQAIVQPLAGHNPPMSVDTALLEQRLLPELAAEHQGQFIHPTHLQIVCNRLYPAALRANVHLIGAESYPVGGVAAVLADYLDARLREAFAEPGQRELARAVLQQMVSAGGERVFVTAAAASLAVDAEAGRVQAILDALRVQGIVERRANPDEPPVYSVSHHQLAGEIAGWFDRDQALDRCAQETLDRAWEDWYAQWSVSGEAPPPDEHALAVPELLVGANRLAEIRSRRERLSIDSPQLGLLLHSAVRHQFDVGYWAGQLAQDDRTKGVLVAVNRQVDENAPGHEVDLAAAALGVTATSAGALARAATGARQGHVRHSAALALAVTGMDAVQAGLHGMDEATPGRRGWRKAQALAQMKAAGFAIPQVSLGLQTLVAAWSLGLRVWDSRWRLVTESLLAGVGAGIGLGIALLINMLGSPSQLWPIFVLRSLLSVPVGFAIGVLAVAIAWVVWLSAAGGSPRSRAVRQVIGIWLGFVVAVLVLWWPWDSLGKLVVELAGLGSGLPSDRSLVATYILGGSRWGLGSALGYQSLAGVRRTPSYGRALIGTGIGGAVGCLLAFYLVGDVPLAEPA